jgi:hypothetical protein
MHDCFLHIPFYLAICNQLLISFDAYKHLHVTQHHLPFLCQWTHRSKEAVLFILLGWDDVCVLWPSSSLSFIPQMIYIWATVEWYWQGKTKELREKCVPVPLCPPQIPHGLNQAQTQASEVRGWAMAWPKRAVLQGLSWFIPEFLFRDFYTACNFHTPY